MENDIRYIIETHPYLLNLYQKDELRHIKDIYFNHVKHKRIVENDFSFLQFVAKLHELGYKPHKYSIIRYDTKKPFSETNIYLKKANNYQKRLDELSKIIEKNERHKVKLKLNNNPYVIIKSENLKKKPEYKLHTKQHSIISITNHLMRYYTRPILKKMRESYSTKRRTRLIADGFTFEQFVLKAYQLGYLDSDMHQIRRLDTTKPFSETNMRLKSTDGLQTKLQNMAKIVHENKRVSFKINEEPFQICLKHPNAKYERRIYIKQ